MPSYDYDLLFGHDPAFGVHGVKVHNKCIKVFYSTIQPSPIRREKIIQRHDEAFIRTSRHFKIPPLPEKDCGASIADWLFYKGDQYSLSLYEPYGFSGDSSHLIRNGIGYRIQDCIERDYSSAKRNFLYLGSWGAIYRGLDRVLEAFKKTPEANVFICGPLLHDTDFVIKHRHLLFKTDNIKTLGFIDVNGSIFQAIASQAASMIYPSPSEGCSGSIISGMHAGLIPIVGKDCSVVMPSPNLLLEDYSIDEIIARIKMVCEMKDSKVKSLCYQALENAKQHYSWDAFKHSFQCGMERIMRQHF